MNLGQCMIRIKHTFCSHCTEQYFRCNRAAPVHPSVYLSISDTFFTMFLSSDHHQFFGRYYHWQKWCPCKRSRSKVKVAEVKRILSQFGHFWTVTPVWIHQWLWYGLQSLKHHRRGALWFFKVICQISKSHGTKKSPNLTQIGCFRTVTLVTPIWIYQWLWNDAQSPK